MKKIYTAIANCRKFTIAFLAFLFCLSTNIKAQVANYGFSQASGTYTAVTGTTAILSSWDDGVTANNIPIGFSFVFNGITYTTCSINSNGYITFGTTVSTNNSFIPISSGTAYAGAISALGRDLVSNGSSVIYTTLNSAPNRVFIVQWTNARRYSGSSRASDFDFQIRLSETTNIVQVVYGDCVSNYNTQLPVQVGLRGANNSDYNNRTTGNNWPASTAGASNAATCNTGNGVGEVPPNGLTYTWAPRPTISVLGSTGGCSGSSITINGANLSGANAANVTIGGTAVSSITTNTATQIVAVVGNGTTGQVSVTNLGGTATSGATNFTVSVPPTISAQPTPLQTVCLGSSVAFSVTATGTATLTYQWKKNGTNIVAATGSSYSISAVSATDAATYTVVVTNGCGSITSNNAVLTVGAGPGSWIGSVSTDWNTAGNWCGGIPTATTDVTIPAVGTVNFQPIIGAAGGICRNITINGTLAMSGAFNLNVNGDWVNNGVLNAATGTVTFTGATNNLLAGTTATTFYNLIINKSVSATTVTSTTSVFTTTNLTVTQGDLILTSPPALPAGVSYTVTGNILVAAAGILTDNVTWDANGHLLSVGGNIAIDGIFNYNPANLPHVNMNGAGAKTVRSGANPLSGFGFLTLSNGDYTASGQITVNSNFWAMFGTVGSFTTGNNTITANAALLIDGGTTNITGGIVNVTGGLYVGYSGLAGILNLSAGILNADFVNVGDGTLIGTLNHSGGTANIGNLLISTTGTYTASSSPTINISGNWTNNKTFIPAGSTVTFNNTGAAQTISGTAASQNFNNIVIAKAGQALNVSGIAGNNINVAGNWTNNGGTFAAGAGRVTFNGGPAQQINGPTVTSFNNVTISSTGVTLNGIDANITGNGSALNFTTGKINTGGNTLILGNTSTISGAAAGTGWVNGNLQMGVTASGTRDFAIGDASNYTPVSLILAGVSAAGSITASTTAGQNPNIGTSTIDNTLDVNRYYSLTNNGVTLTSYNPTFTFVPGDVIGGANTANFILGLYDGSWSYPTVGTKTATSTQATGVTTFGTIAIGISAAPTVTTSPANQAGCEGGSASFTAKATNNPASTVVWQISTDGGVIFGPLGLVSPYGVSTSTTGSLTTSILTINPLTIGLTGYQYKATFTNTKGVATSAAATLTVNPLPVVFSVTGGGGYCSGAAGLPVGVSGSQLGVNYTLSPGGSVVAGTGAAITFGNKTAGTYTVSAAYAGTGCASSMTGNATITTNPLPTAFTVTGGGGYCVGGSGVPVGLSGSQSGVNYTLSLGGSVVAGTGAAISFGNQTTSGTYTVSATNTSTGCSNAMSGSVSVTINPLPTVFNVTGGGTYCSGGAGVVVGISNSQTGVNYQLYNGVSTVGSPVAGTGSAKSFGNQTGAGTYTVVATNSTTGCTNPMSGNVTVSINALPIAYTVTGGGSYCNGGSGVVIGLSNSQTGVNYQLYNGAATSGSAVAGTTGSAINFGNRTAAGTYTVVATITSTGCTSPMSNSVAVAINPLPVANAGPDQNICSGSTTIGFLPAATGGTTPYTYSWSAGVSNVAIANPTAPAGTYILTVSDANGCSNADAVTVAYGTVAKSWIGDGTSGAGIDNNFNNPLNWNPAGVPGACNDVTMNIDISQITFVGNNLVIPLNSNATIKSLNIHVGGFQLALLAGTFRLDANSKSLTILNNTIINTDANTFAFTPAATYVSVSTGVVTYGGNLTTTVNNGCFDYPFISTNNGFGKFYVNGNASLAGIGYDFGNKPAQVIFDGATGSTQTITQNSGGQAILLGVTSTDIGQTNSPTVILAGGGTGGFQSIGNLNINNSSTLDVGTSQTINRRTSGGTLNLAGGAFMKLGASTGGQVGSNFPSNYTIINLNSATVPTSTVEYYGASAQTIFATPAYGNLVLSSASTKTAGNGLTIKGDATINTSGDVFAGGTFSHSLAGNWYNNASVGSFISTGLLTFNGSAAQNIGGTSGSTFNNVTINNAAGVTLSQPQVINSLLTLTTGNLDITNQNLTMGSAAPAIAGVFSASTMIIADGGGQVRKNYTANGSYLFPIGDKTGTLEYSPITLNYTSGSYAAGAYAGVRVVNAKHPAINAGTPDYINRYWPVTNSGITTPVYTITSTYLPADVVGSEANLFTVKYPGSLPFISYTAANTVTHTLSAAGVTNTGLIDITGIGKPPTVSIVGGGVTICLGTSVSLTTNVTSGTSVTYLWTGQGLSSTSTQNITVTPTSAGAQIYTVIVTDLNGLTATASVTINVNQPSIAPTGATATPLTICAGSSSTLAQTGGTLGTGASWHWYTDPGFTTSIGLLTPSITVSPTVTTTYYVRAEGGTSPCAANTASANVTVTVNQPGQWLGITNEWNDALNWGCGNIPNLTTNVVIPTTPHDPVISTATAMAQNITVSTGAKLTVTGQVLQVAGTISSNHLIFASAGTIELKGAPSISGDYFDANTIKNLTVSSTASTTGGSLKIIGQLGFGGTGKTFTANAGNVTLLSSFAATANVAQLKDGNDISGNNFTVERFINTGDPSTTPGTHGKTWQLLATPTNGQTIHEAWQENALSPNADPHSGYGLQLTGTAYTVAAPHGYDAYTQGSSIKIYNSANDQYDPVPNTDLTALANPKGYYVYVRGDRSVTALNGNPSNSTVLRSTGILNKGNQGPFTIPSGKYGTLGNPYAAPIDLRVLHANSTNITNDVYVWDPYYAGTYGAGGFVTLTWDPFNNQYILGASPNPGGTYPGPVVNILQSSQAFFMKSNGVGDASITFTENTKVDGAGAGRLVNGITGVDKPLAILGVNLKGTSVGGSAPIFLDGALAIFGEDYSNQVDWQDGAKISNSSNNVGFLRSGKFLAVERRQLPTATDTLNLYLTNSKVQAYTWNFSGENIDAPGLTAYLWDKYLNTKTPLSLSSPVNVDFSITNVAASAAADRFKIVFGIAKPLPVTITTVKATRNTDKTITVNWKVENEINIVNYSIDRSADGVTFTNIGTTPPANSNGNSGSYDYGDVNPLSTANYYRIKALSQDGQVQYSNVVKVNPLTIPGSITVYPNPVQNKEVNMVFVNEPAGTYELELTNKIGQNVYKGKVTISTVNEKKKVSLVYVTAAGVYHLNIKGPDGVMHTLELVVEL